MSNEDLPHIHLIGNRAENFYALGKRDKFAFEDVHAQISRLCIRNDFMAKLLKSTAELSGRIKKNTTHLQHEDIQAYAEGLERSFDDVLLTMLMPEMVASFNKWAPDLLALLPGCSSLFSWDQESQGIIHSRILDYALSGPFEENQRSILYEFKGQYKIFSYGSAGIALPGLSAMNEKGLTLALHYKHGKYFDLTGESIFYIAYDILAKCADVREATKLLRQKKSISFWGFYLSDASGEVASLDICGNELYQERFDLKDHGTLYFNNRALLKNTATDQIQPFGNANQCKMRKEVVEKRLANQSGELSMEKTLEIIAKPSGKKAQHARDWKLGPLTPASIQVYSFHGTQLKSFFISHSTPKVFNGNFLEQTNLFTNVQTKVHKKKYKADNYHQGLKYTHQFQSYLDKNNIPKAYHSLQMAIQYFKGYEEFYILSFYFTVMEYIYESDKRDMSYIYHDFLNLEGKLPSYLNDHRLLFLLRTSKLLEQTVENNINLIENKALKELYRKEFNLNGMAIKGLKYLIFPRIEILDIIYAY